MIPDVPTVLGGVARTLTTDIASEIRTPYAELTLTLASGLLMIAAQEFDRAAARLVEENEALARIFDEAARVVTDGALAGAMEEAAAAPAPALEVTALRARNRVLRALLIRLHAHVESLDDPAARRLEERIWAELAASTRRRHLDLAIAG